jgi:hypothetical protein
LINPEGFGIIVIPASLRSDFIHIAGMPIHIPLESAIHIAGIRTLNRMMIGWANYFCLGPVSPAYRAVERHARKRLRQWLRAKHKLRGQATKRFSITVLHQVLGLVELTTRTSSFPWAKS